MITITDWLAAKIISKGWAEKIDPTNVPNCVANLRDALKNQVWDPNQDYHYPWQSGMTGIGYNKANLKKTNKPEPKSLVDLWALPPTKVTFLNEKRDTFGSVCSSSARPPTRRRPRPTTSRPSTTTSSRSPTAAAPVHRQRLPPGLRGQEDLGGDDLVRRPRLVRRGRRRAGSPRPRARYLDRQHGHPGGRGEQVHRRADDELRVRPEDRGPDRELRLLRVAGQGRRGGASPSSTRRRRRTRCCSRPTTSWPSSTTSSSSRTSSRRR